MFTIRSATLDDLDSLVAFSVAMARQTEGRNLCKTTVRASRRAIIENPHLGFTLVAVCSKGPLVGEITVGGREWSEWANGQYWWVTSCCIRRRWHERGVDRALWGGVLSRASDEGVRVIGLRANVYSSNSRAQRWLPELGLRQNGYLV